MPKLSTDTFRVEKDLRSILGLVALVLLPPVFGLLALAKTPGLTDPTALDHAQLARQIAAGHGFTTNVLRPLLLALHPDALPHPDLLNAPLHPLLLAGAFAAAGPSEQAIAALGLGLWLLTVWLVFWMARYWWDRRVAGLATVFCVCSTAGLMTAAAGLPEPALALLVFGAVATVFPKPGSAKAGDTGLADWQPAAAGVLSGAAALTDYRLLPLALVLGAYLAKTQRRRAVVVALFGVGLALALLPWGIRNLVVSGRLFGFYWYGTLENTRQFPGDSIWRLTHAPDHPLLYLLMHPWDLARKLALGLSQYRLAGLGLIEPVVLLLCVVALFGAPATSSRRRLAWIVTSSAALTLLLSCLTRPDVLLLLPWTPVLGCVAAAQLVAWVQANVGSFTTANARLRLSTLGMRSLTYSGVVAAVAFPVVMQLGHPRSPARTDTTLLGTALRQRLSASGVVVTDVPAFTAWHLNRPCLLLCQHESDLAALETQAGELAAVYLSPALGQFSQQERGDWWIWVASTRGEYRGLVAVPNSTLPGILRLPQETTAATTQVTDWLDGLQKSVREDPESAEAQTQLAFGYFTLGRLREAQRTFQEARRLDEYNVEALTGQWQTMAQLSQADGTLRLAQLAGQVGPQDPRAKPLLEQAAAHFQQVFAQHPDDPWLLLNLIVCRSRLGEWQEVEAYYARLAHALPKTFPSRLLLASLYLQQGETAKAAAECDLLVQEHPDMPTAHQMAGRVWLAQDKPEEALREFATTARLRPHSVAAQLQAGQVCQRLQHRDEAIAYYETALKLAPKLVEAKLNLAQVYLQESRADKAIGLYSEILQTTPNNPMALNNLAELLSRNGKVADAMVLTHRAVNLYPSNSLIRDTTGWVAFLADDKDEALVHLREAIRLSPRQGLSHYRLGRVLLAQKRNAEAQESFRRALECGLPEQEKQEAGKLLAGV